MLKKVLAGVLAIAMICVFAAACGGGSSDSGGSQPAPASSPPAQQASPPAANNSGDDDDDDILIVILEDDDDDDDILIVILEDDDDDDYMSEEDYEEDMLGFQETVGNQLRYLDELLQEADYGFYDYDDLVVWCQNFIALKNAFESQAYELEVATPWVPEYFQLAHGLVTDAINAIVDAFSSFEYAVDAAMDGDDEEYWVGLVVFVANIEYAADLWNAAYA